MGYTTRVTPLHIASLFWNADAIRVLLDHCGGDVDRTAMVRVNDPALVDGSTTLHYLVRHWDQLDLLRYLVQCGATVNATNHRGNTPLHEAMRGGLFVFDRRGCSRPLEPVDSDRSIQARDAMLGVLIEAGGSMEPRNGAGDTPTQVWDQVTERQRRRLQHRDAAQRLLARGRGAGIIDGRDNSLL
ncbi:hypothetical protein BDV39DRAFT_194271 [Aspergillus sergii]|uniref:Uncharacterized protein n=1 Tax=Aspergillus sergii TaxID=1034303 RepID=A0A5N6X267_9EURO|nr:hypothetical protein BDV39DRAFT_194271 [Aspergillus sergii]